MDRGLPAARAALEAQLGQLSGEPKLALSALLADIGQLGQIRHVIDGGTMSPTGAFQAYTNIVDAEFQYFYASIQDKSAALADVSIGAVDGDYALEMTSREATLVAGALATGGQLSPSVHELFTASVASRRLMLDEATSVLTPSLRSAYLAVGVSREYQQFQALENQIQASAGNGPIPVTALPLPDS